MIKPFYIKKNDRAPYYRVKVLDGSGAVVDITGATIYCTMKNTSTGTKEIDRQTTGISITGAAAGEFEYRWQSGDTDTVGTYHIEFEVNPLGAPKFTIPANPTDVAVVRIEDSLDTT